ncbi:hypothetical protein ACHMW6_11505 [Pseudoduganella sp. UC29_106]|uniref:hypothetical protein n=1 Tax=Pseudoduganella sp. UC29_106 TaxID=3374553 RepID=UPI003757165D
MTTHTSHSPSHDISAWRDQYRLTHTFHLSLGTNEPIAGQVESTLKRSQAKVDKWVISRRGGFYDHCITVEGIGDESARELRKEFANLNGEIKVHVEHMVHFAGAAAHR